MGPRSVRTRPVRHPAGPDPDLDGRPLFRRHVPGDARPTATPGHVRGHAGPPEHHGGDSAWSSPTCSAKPWPTTRCSPARSTSISAIATGRLPYRSLTVPARDACQRRRFQPVAVVNYPRRRRAAHADHRVQAPHRAGECPHLASATRSRAPGGRPLLPDPPAREPGAVQALRGARAGAQSDVSFVGPPGDLPLLQHGPGRGAGAGDLPGASWSSGGRCRVVPTNRVARTAPHCADGRREAASSLDRAVATPDSSGASAMA